MIELQRYARWIDILRENNRLIVYCINCRLFSVHLSNISQHKTRNVAGAHNFPYIFARRSISTLNFNRFLLLSIFAVFVHQAADWFTNMSRSARMYQNAVNVKRNWRESDQHVHWSVPASRNVKRQSPEPTVVYSAIDASANVSYALSWLKNRKSWKCWAVQPK